MARMHALKGSRVRHKIKFVMLTPGTQVAPRAEERKAVARATESRKSPASILVILNPFDLSEQLLFTL